jgi:hypothetical protein
MPVHEAEQDAPVHVVGSSVNLPDMSAHLAAKVSVSHDQQADPGRMAAIYDDMAAKFQCHGLTIPAVEAVRQYFTNLEGEGAPCPAGAPRPSKTAIMHADPSCPVILTVWHICLALLAEHPNWSTWLVLPQP